MYVRGHVLLQKVGGILGQRRVGHCRYSSELTPNCRSNLAHQTERDFLFLFAGSHPLLFPSPSHATRSKGESCGVYE